MKPKSFEEQWREIERWSSTIEKRDREREREVSLIERSWRENPKKKSKRDGNKRFKCWKR